MGEVFGSSPEAVMEFEGVMMEGKVESDGDFFRADGGVTGEVRADISNDGIGLLDVGGEGNGVTEFRSDFFREELVEVSGDGDEADGS